MNYMIKDLKSMAAGTEIAGLPLYIRTGRGTFRDAEGILFQEVRFMDKSGEITGHILQDEPDETEYRSHQTTGLPPGTWRSKQTVCIMKGFIQDTDERKKEGVKIVIYECFSTAVNLSYEQGQEIDAEDWKQLRQDEIKGKIRHGEVCRYMGVGVIRPKMTEKEAEAVKDSVLYWQEFIMTGE